MNEYQRYGGNGTQVPGFHPFYVGLTDEKDTTHTAINVPHTVILYGGG